MPFPLPAGPFFKVRLWGGLYEGYKSIIFAGIRIVKIAKNIREIYLFLNHFVLECCKNATFMGSKTNFNKYIVLYYTTLIEF